MTPPEVPRQPESAPNNPDTRGAVRTEVDSGLTTTPEELDTAKKAGAEAFADDPESQSKWEKFIEKAMGLATMFSLFVSKMIPGAMKKSIEEQYGDLVFEDRVQVSKEKIQQIIEDEFIAMEGVEGEHESQKHEYLSLKVAGRLLGLNNIGSTGSSLEFAAKLKNEKNADGSEAFDMKDDMVQMMMITSRKSFPEGTTFIVNQMEGWKGLKGSKEIKEFMENTYQLVFVATGDGKMVRGYFPGKGVITVELGKVAKGPLSIAAIFENKTKIPVAAATPAESEAAVAPEATPPTPEPVSSEPEAEPSYTPAPPVAQPAQTST
ncbi:hypothetical protein CVV38_02200 [Candidatus Peregrinibacteria bacterium HGW-Peregrinibacteria-1]|jgi:hypothetical protein|nr:MAG: hypothetical protein CVV38_02200 [Candidatus Peregrinibacteria bacterium HGW-Peregrinibacteria-1]